jgi:hypothetical protein
MATVQKAIVTRPKMGLGIPGRIEVDAIELTNPPSPTAAKPSKFATLVVTPSILGEIGQRGVE